MSRPTRTKITNVTIGAWPFRSQSGILGIMKTSLRKQVGLRAKELRLAAGMSQEAFAAHSDFARSYMSRIERGGANLSLDAIEQLAAALGVEAAALFVEAGSSLPISSVPSISPISPIAPATLSSAAPAATPIMVPFSDDGSYFHPGLMRPNAKTYRVGNKEASKYFPTFDKALEHLNSMKPARWWRPNAKGNWCLVTAVRWGPLPDVHAAGS
jgi:transcriptional regulator with XRE-family HTH domain